MALLRIGARNGLHGCATGLAAVAAVLLITSDAADARHHRRVRVHYVHHTGRVHHHERAEAYSPPSASIVVDGNTGEVLQASNPDAPRHPASLTKIMTLYLLFERLDAGKMSLDTALRVSEHASDQDPTKLGLKAGDTISVENAIKGVVTRSANDAAVVIAENLGGTESEFAKLMTQKAHALGMSRTTYVNASGLPDDDQITTARDQALLGRVIQDRFPRYYKYFSTPSFVFHGETIRTHDHLLGKVEGVDGIKTGFTRASGFNLVTSVHRDGRYVVAVVLGGRSSFERDAHMRELIGAHIKEAALHRVAPAIAEQVPQRQDNQQVALAQAPVASRANPASVPSHAEPASVASRADPAPAAPATSRVATGSSDPIQPLLVKTVSYRIAPVQTAPLGPMPALVPVPAPASLPQPAAAQPAAAPQATMPVPQTPQIVVAAAEPLPLPAATQTEPVRPEPVSIASAMPEPASSEPALVRPRGGWLIQIGAFDGEDEAKQHLSAAQMKVRDTLAAADPFTERVQKGDKSLYRARFAGFDKATAEAACRQLKHNDFDCMAVKN
jgi:D-alanyl-D-alanine carboxypeptidase